MPGLRRALAARHEPARPLSLRVLPEALRAALGVPQLRRPLDDRADVRHGERHLPQLPGLDASAHLTLGDEQLASVEVVVLEDGPAVGVEPVGARAVVIQLDSVAVGVGEVDRDGAAVVGGVVDGAAVVEQAAQSLAELAPVGLEEGHVVQPGVPRRRRRPARALPGVEPDVVVLIACGQEGGVEAGLAPVGGHAEAEGVTVEADRPIEV